MDEKKYDSDDIVVHSAAQLDAEAPGVPHDQVYGDDIQKGLKRGLKPRHVSVSWRAVEPSGESGAVVAVQWARERGWARTGKRSWKSKNSRPSHLAHTIVQKSTAPFY